MQQDVSLLREQYEDLPYPLRDPNDEYKTLLIGYIDLLDFINHRCFAGKQSFDDGARVLVAGGGTGDSLILLAEQLRERDAEIIYLDLSLASMEIAKARAEVRGLDNITWHHGSLLDVASIADIGVFDYINCTGVLHHLESPLDGLKALQSVLAPDGAIGLMLYGKYAREAMHIYDIQSMMRFMLPEGASREEKLLQCREFFASLPPDHFLSGYLERNAEIQSNGDSGIYDLLLHSQDIPFTVPDVYRLTEAAGLVFQSFALGYGADKQLYDPAWYLHDDVLQPSCATLPKETQAAIAEILSMRMLRHFFYVKHQSVPEPSWEDQDMVPFFTLAFGTADIQKKLRDAFREPDDVVSLSVALTESQHVASIPNTQVNQKLLMAIDGKKTIGEICEEVTKQCNESGEEISKDEVHQALCSLVNASFASLDVLLLRHKSIKPFQTLPAIQSRMNQYRL